MARALLKAGAKIEAKNGEGCVPLITSCKEWRPDVLQVLIEGGAEVNAVDEEGIPACCYAAQKGDSAVVGALIAAGCDARRADIVCRRGGRTNA